MGDTQLGAKIRLFDEDNDGWRPMLGLYPIFTLPTGSARRGLGAGVGSVFLPVWADRSLGKWTLDGGVGLAINPGGHGRDALFAGSLVLYQLTSALTVGGEVFEQTAQQRGGTNAQGFNLGGSYDLSRSYHLLFSVGRGLGRGASADDRLSFYLALQLSV